MTSLRLDWASHEAAEYACRKWHYSGCISAGKSVKVGIWEDGQFIGVVVFGLGATPNLSKRYGLTMEQCCELTRVALTTHQTPVTRILSIAMKMLRTRCPGVRLIVSFADTAQGHHGGIYQGGGVDLLGFRPARSLDHSRPEGPSQIGRGEVRNASCCRSNKDRSRGSQTVGTETPIPIPA